jgi:hypothetical protein
MRCPKCGTEIIKEYPSERKIKLRTSIVVFEDGKKPVGRCPKCHTDVDLPVKLENENAMPVLRK